MIVSDELVGWIFNFVVVFFVTVRDMVTMDVWGGRRRSSLRKHVFFSLGVGGCFAKREP